MITAAEARKISESYDDGILENIEKNIREAAEKGERSVSVDSRVGKYIYQLEEMGYEIKSG